PRSCLWEQLSAHRARRLHLGERQPYVYLAEGIVRPVTLFTTARTLTVPTTFGGATTVHSVIEMQLTDVAFTKPNLNFVAFVPTANPVPVTVTLVPPAARPLFGLTPVVVRAQL